MPTKTRRQQKEREGRTEAAQLEVRIKEILDTSRSSDRPMALALATAERRLQDTLEKGDARNAGELSLTVKRLRTDLGLAFGQRPEGTDANSLLWLRVLAKASASLRFDEAHLEQVRLQEALALDLSRTGDEDTREKLAALTADLKAAWAKELPLLFRQEMERLCSERGLDPAPDWLTVPELWV